MLTLYITLLEDERDKARFLRLHIKYYNAMMRTAMGYFPGDQTAAEDAVHESFLKIIENFSKISAISREELGSYIVIIVKNTCIDMLRKQKRLVLTDDWAPYERPAEGSAEDGFSRLVAIIRSMPETYRAVLELRFVLELEYKEIAKTLGISESAVKDRIHRGRKLLIEKLREEGYEL